MTSASDTTHPSGLGSGITALHAKWGWIVALGVVYLIAGFIALGSMPVETCDHQVLGWRNGRRCAESLKRKSCKGVHESRQTDQDEEDAD